MPVLIFVTIKSGSVHITTLCSHYHRGPETQKCQLPACRLSSLFCLPSSRYLGTRTLTSSSSKHQTVLGKISEAACCPRLCWTLQEKDCRRRSRDSSSSHWSWRSNSTGRELMLSDQCLRDGSQSPPRERHSHPNTVSTQRKTKADQK